jgi:molybdopterin/thiamine biosynthesis adenylyltransferase
MKFEKIKKLPHDQCVQIRTRPMLEGLDVKDSPTDRQERIKGFDQSKVSQTGILCCGAGGLAAEQGVALVRKGYGGLFCMDHDEFDATNYARQRCFAPDLHQNKALCFVKNLAKEALLETELVGLATGFADAEEFVDWDKIQVAVCNVDNNPTRVEMARLLRTKQIPVVFSGVSETANNGYVFVQESRPGTACFGCAFPDKVDDQRHPCPNTPACVDILKVIGGFVLYAIDSLIMDRPRNWNYRTVNLSGFAPDGFSVVQPNPNCSICGNSDEQIQLPGLEVGDFKNP